MIFYPLNLKIKSLQGKSSSFHFLFFIISFLFPSFIFSFIFLVFSWYFGGNSKSKGEVIKEFKNFCENQDLAIFIFTNPTRWIVFNLVFSSLLFLIIICLTWAIYFCQDIPLKFNLTLLIALFAFNVKCLFPLLLYFLLFHFFG